VQSGVEGRSGWLVFWLAERRRCLLVTPGRVVTIDSITLRADSVKTLCFNEPDMMDPSPPTAPLAFKDDICNIFHRVDHPFDYHNASLDVDF